jgi:hypothetical protein
LFGDTPVPRNVFFQPDASDPDKLLLPFHAGSKTTAARTLLTEMLSAPGQFILTTHSPYLVSTSESRDLASIVRLGTANCVACQRRLDAGHASAR